MPMSPKERRRVKICQQAQALISGGKTVAETSRILEIPLGTLERWRRKYLADGVDGLRDNYTAVGRPAVADCLPPDFADFIRRKAAKCGSKALTYKRIVHDRKCPEKLRDYLLPKLLSGKQISLPLSLRRVAEVPPDLAAKYRGDTAYDHIGFKLTHSPTVFDPIAGEFRDLIPGDIFISDDMSLNHYFWCELTDADARTRNDRDRKLAEKHGVFIGRQGLYTIDARGKWLGADLLGRPTDAYTAADILRHFRHVLEDHGMPRIAWILEKGIWMARTINGMTVVIDDTARGETVAGLSSLGFRVVHVNTSEGKALIEGAFAYLQKTLDFLEVPTIGRKRGEMERVQRLIRRVHNGSIHPADAGLPYISKMADFVKQAMVLCNGDFKNGVIQAGVPDDEWHRAVTEHPLRLLKPEHMGVFMPVKFSTMINGGHVVKHLEGERYRFTAPELFAVLGSGYRVLVAFDPGEPHAGAEIYNLETGARNIKGFAPNAWIGHADLSPDVPLFGMSSELAESTRRRKAARRAFAIEYRGTGLFGTRAGKASERRMADGTLARVETNFGDSGRTEDAVRECALPAAPAGIPASSYRRKQLTESEIDAAAAEAAAMEERLRERGMLLPTS